MKVRSGPWQGEPVGEDNCNIARCCGKEVLAKAMARGTRIASGLDVLDESACEDEVQYLPGRHLGICGGRVVKVSSLTPGGLHT